MKLKIFLSLAIFVLSISMDHSQTQTQNSKPYKFFVGSTLWELGNFIPNDPNKPDLGQLHFGYRITPKNVVSIELKTWKYAWPLGIPFGSLKQAPEEKYPGYVRAFGIGLVYQHFWWKGLYTSLDAGNMLQRYMDEENKHIQNGYQLFMTYRLGYHFEFFKNRFFFEPSISVTHWPFNTNVPASFVQLENKWHNYFLFEPGLHFGFNF